MTFFRVNRLWRDQRERNYSEFKDFPTFADARGARGFANSLARKEGEVWIEQREPGRMPINTDRAGDSDPMTREHLAQLRVQIRSLGAKQKLEDA